MPNTPDQYQNIDIDIPGGKMRFRSLNQNFFRLEEILRNQNSSKIDCEHKIGSLWKLDGPKMTPASVITDCPKEYIPKENKRWGNLCLDEIGLIHGTDKSSSKHDLLNNYEKIFLERFGSEWRNQAINLIEIGVCNGASIRTWAKALPNGQILGIDNIKECTLLCRDLSNVRLLYADATNQSLLNKIHPCQIIIDDGSHLVQDMRKALNLLWGNLTKGGVYIIEDTVCMYDMNYIKRFEYYTDESKYKLERMKFIDSITQMVNKRIVSYLQIQRNCFILFKN